MTLLVALGDTEADRDLLASARGIAAAAGWSVRAVHVRCPGGPKFSSAEIADLELEEVEGDAAATLTDLARRAGVDAVAVGLGRPGGRGLGRVTRALLESMAAPVLLVREGMRPVFGLRRLLVPLEGSPSASVAMKRADDAFCKRGREIVMLHVATSYLPGERGSLPAPRIIDQEHYEWLAWKKEFRMRFSRCPEGGRHRICVRVGDPRRVIAAESKAMDAELIVLSWWGSFAGGRGAVVRALIATAPCPLLLVSAAV